MYKKILVVMTASLLLFTLTGCVKIPKLENGEEVIAKLNDKQFTADDLYKELRNQYGITTLVNMIDNYIISQELENTDEEMQQATAYVKQMKEYYESSGQNWEEVLSSNGYTEESLTNLYKDNYAKESVAKKYYKDTISEDEINKYYESDIIGDITAKHILITIDADENTSDEEKASKEQAAYNKAMEVINKLNAGEDFASLAKEYSDDGSSSEGGSLAPFNKQSNYSKEFLDAAIALNSGEYTKTPVKSEYGYHIILVESKKDKPTLDEVKTSIIEVLSEEKINANENYLVTAWKNLREKYNLEIFDTIIDEKYKTAMSNY